MRIALFPKRQCLSLNDSIKVLWFHLFPSIRACVVRFFHHTEKSSYHNMNDTAAVFIHPYSVTSTLAEIRDWASNNFSVWTLLNCSLSPANVVLALKLTIHYIVLFLAEESHYCLFPSVHLYKTLRKNYKEREPLTLMSCWHELLSTSVVV